MQSRCSLRYVWQINPLSSGAVLCWEIISPKSQSSWMIGYSAHPQEVSRFTTHPTGWKLVQSSVWRTQRPWWLKAREGTVRHLLYLSYTASLALVWKTVTYTLTSEISTWCFKTHLLYNCWERSKACSRQAHGESRRDKDGMSCIKFPAAATVHALTGATSCAAQCLSPALLVSANTVPVNSHPPKQALNPLHRHPVVTNEAVQQEMWFFLKVFPLLL